MPHLRPALTLLLTLSLTTHTLSAAPPSTQPDWKKIDAAANLYIKHKRLVAISVGVITPDGKQHFRNYGKTHLPNGKTPTKNTIYEIGSISKVFTGTLLAHAVINKKLKLNTPINALLPKNAQLKINEKPIQLFQLSTHSSGLGRMPHDFKPQNPLNPYADYSTQKLYATIHNHKPPAPPNKRWAYSNLAVGLLGHILATKQNSTYETLLKSQIAQPLKMNNTSISLSSYQKKMLAKPYNGDLSPGHNWDLNALDGAGAIRSNTTDMLKFAAANLNPTNSTLAKAIQLTHKTHYQAKSSKLNMGLGWIINAGKTKLSHSGQTGGYHTNLTILPKQKIAVVVLTNTAISHGSTLAKFMTDTLQGKKPTPPNIKPHKKTIAIAKKERKKYIGIYSLILAPRVKFTITQKDGIFFAKLTGQQTVRIYPESKTHFHYRVVKATLEFHFEKDGSIKSLTLHQNGQKQVAVKSKK